MLVSKETGWFYNPADGGDIPADAVELSGDEYAELLAGLASGRVMNFTGDGRPYLEDAPPLGLAQVREMRQTAYRLESDPLKIEADFDAQLSGEAPDYSAWIAKVEEIKARYPLPAE